MPITNEELRNNYYLAVIVYLCDYGEPYTATDPSSGDAELPWEFTLVDNGQEPHPNPQIATWEVPSKSQPNDALLEATVSMAMIDAAKQALYPGWALEEKERKRAEARLALAAKRKQESEQKRREAEEAARREAESAQQQPTSESPEESPIGAGSDLERKRSAPAEPSIDSLRIIEIAPEPADRKLLDRAELAQTAGSGPAPFTPTPASRDIRSRSGSWEQVSGELPDFVESSDYGVGFESTS